MAKKSSYFKSGESWVWLNAAAVSLAVIMVIGLLLLIAWRGLGHFWSDDVYLIELSEQKGNEQVLGEIFGREVDKQGNTHLYIKVGNRDITHADFRWVEVEQEPDNTPADVTVLERREHGNFYGFLQQISVDGRIVDKQQPEQMWQTFQSAIERAEGLYDELDDIQRSKIGSINYDIEQLRLKKRRLELKGKDTPEALADIEQQKAELNKSYKVLEKQRSELYQQLGRDSIVMQTIDGQSIDLKVSAVVQAFQPNQMSIWAKLLQYLGNIGSFLSDEPREANTEGGVFPAIFGTVLMVILMSIIVTPIGVIAAIYLREYAKQGLLTRIIRIAVNNLAGVPSIVYGVFGLGFFVYFLGGSIDDLFYPEAKPAPTFGAPGLLWASLTLALLTLPVVIVATEEGLARIPKSIREGSLALGATKAETLWRTVVPMASPSIMTGLILAVARAAGEVAPLMLVGVVKLAPTLPIDGNAPYLHLDRMFMHLGFQIYDVGFRSPHVEAAAPLVYATSLLLVLVIVVLNMLAIRVRNRLREKYRALEN